MVINDPGNDYDFRVESDTNTHALFVQGNDGFVGIGASAPAYKLDVFSGINNSDIAKFTGAQSAKGLLISTYASNGNDGGVRLSSTDSLAFSTAATERLRIKSAGQTRFVPLAADPAGAEAGDVYYNSGTNKLRLYDGSTWVDLN